MSRVLKRPMFRKGGPAMEGVMTGIEDRTNFQFGTTQKMIEERAKLLQAAVGQPSRGAALTNFLLQFGPAIASRPTTGNVFADIAGAARAPAADLGKQIAAEDAFRRQLGLSAATQVIGEQAELAKLERKLGLQKGTIEKNAQDLFRTGRYKTIEEARIASADKFIYGVDKSKDTQRKALQEQGVIDTVEQDAIIGARLKYNKLKEEFKKKTDITRSTITTSHLENARPDEKGILKVKQGRTGRYTEDTVYMNPTDQQAYVYRNGNFVIIPNAFK